MRMLGIASLKFNFERTILSIIGVLILSKIKFNNSLNAHSLVQVDRARQGIREDSLGAQGGKQLPTSEVV